MMEYTKAKISICRLLPRSIRRVVTTPARSSNPRAALAARNARYSLK
jgi:hypothetical protein